MELQLLVINKNIQVLYVQCFIIIAMQEKDVYYWTHPSNPLLSNTLQRELCKCNPLVGASLLNAGLANEIKIL